MSKPARLRPGNWLAILAMCLLLSGPWLSQGLLTEAAALPGWLNELACGEQHDGAPASMPEAWEKCGYCVLLFSAPTLSPDLHPATLHTLRTAHVLHSRLPDSPFARTPYPDAPTRAPPRAV